MKNEATRIIPKFARSSTTPTITRTMSTTKSTPTNDAIAAVEGETKTEPTTEKESQKETSTKKKNTIVHVHYCPTIDGFTVTLSGSKDSENESTAAPWENFELERVSKFTNEMFDTLVIQALANSCTESSLDVSKFNDESKSRTEFGSKKRIIREVQWLRRGLQSYEGENIRDEDTDDDDEEKTTGQKSFSSVQPISLDIDHYDFKIDMEITSVLCSKICHDSFKNKMWKPIREMMREAEITSVDIVLMTGLKLPGQFEFLTKQMYLMAASKAFRDTWSSLPDVLVTKTMNFVEDLFDFEDIVYSAKIQEAMDNCNGRCVLLREPTDDNSEGTSFGSILATCESWKEHQQGPDWAKQMNEYLKKDKEQEASTSNANLWMFFTAMSGFCSQNEDDDYNTGDSEYFESSEEEESEEEESEEEEKSEEEEE